MAENLEIKQQGNIFLFHWHDQQAEAKLSRIQEHGDRVSGELLFRSTAPGSAGHLHQASLNLLSTHSRNTFAKQLLSRRNDADWPALVEQVCVHALSRLRQGEPVVLVTATQPVAEEQYILYPLAPLGNPTILFGEGGTAKSHLALLCALIIEMPWPDNPAFFSPGDIPRRGLYLDWEMTERDFRRRLHNLATGCNLPNAALQYRECRAPLADDLERLIDCMATIQAEFVVIDSVAGAAGGDINTAETALRFFGALRQLRTTSIIVAHTSKNPETKKRTPFGSVFFWNYARSIWEIVAHQEEGGQVLDLGLFHRKSNVSGLNKPLGLKFSFKEGATLCESSSPKSVPEIAARMALKTRILDFLKQGPAKKDAIAAALSEEPKTMGSRLYDLKKAGLVVLLPSDLWGLVSHEEDTF